MYNNWEELEQNISNCQKCKLCKERKHIVFGEGNKQADFMLIGEGPGADENTQGLPFVGKACESAGFIFVDKSSPRKIYETIKKAENVLQGGTSLVVFPEGARTYTGRMANFKKGAFFLADQLQLPVVPLTINGSFNVFPRTAKLLTWHPMQLTIHKPIYPLGKKGEDNLQMLMKESFTEIEKDLSEEYKKP